MLIRVVQFLLYLTLTCWASCSFAVKLNLNMTMREFRDFHSRLASDLERPESADLSNRERLIIRDLQSQIKYLLMGKKSVGELGEKQQIKLFNLHEHVISILNESERSRMICERRRMAGSHFKNLECLSLRERERARQTSIDALLNRSVRIR